MSRLTAMLRAIARRLRAMAGLEEGERLPALMIALYSVLGLTAVVLLFAWLTGTPLSCIGTGPCAR